jgi:hypothetical protein
MVSLLQGTVPQVLLQLEYYLYFQLPCLPGLDVLPQVYCPKVINATAPADAG